MNEPKTLKRIGQITTIDPFTCYLYTDGVDNYILVPENLKGHPRLIFIPENEEPGSVIDLARYTKLSPPAVPLETYARKAFSNCKQCGSARLLYTYESIDAEIRCADCSWYCRVRDPGQEGAHAR